MALEETVTVTPHALEKLMSALDLGPADLADRLGGESHHYEGLTERDRLPFPVWDALQRLAYREGYVWDADAEAWTKGVPTSVSSV